MESQVKANDDNDDEEQNASRGEKLVKSGK